MGPIAINVAHYRALKYLAAADRALLEMRTQKPGTLEYEATRQERINFLQAFHHYVALHRAFQRRYAH